MDPSVTSTEWDDGSLADAVFEALAAVTGVDPTDVPLPEVLDLDALQRLFAPMAGDPETDGSSRFEFDVDGCRVTVVSDGTVTAERLGMDASTAAVTDRDAFGDALGRLVHGAATNDVPVEGGWACADGAEGTEWGIEIYRVKRPDGAT